MDSETRVIDNLTEKLKDAQKRAEGLVYDQRSRTLREARPNDDPDRVIHITPEDTRCFLAH